MQRHEGMFSVLVFRFGVYIGRLGVFRDIWGSMRDIIPRLEKGMDETLGK